MSAPEGLTPVGALLQRKCDSLSLSTFSGATSRRSSGGRRLRPVFMGSGPKSFFSLISRFAVSILFGCLSVLYGPPSIGFSSLAAVCFGGFCYHVGGTSSSSSFSSSVLGDYMCSGGSHVVPCRIIVFGLRSHLSITMDRLNSSVGVRDNWVQAGSILGSPYQGVRRYFEVIGKLFSRGSLSLRVDSSERLKLAGSDSWLNLARIFAARSRLT
ncbi:hypothetical protein F2Q69_00050358 [Brassica cretica]|uniref:Uncharacterized protein n=1 Tax=Brassica cretica TaxID=69181 RepID=A0A8S9PZZ7_BRACR|nr:hypothetical protein F2Q69_00050358 [Brassica cretica]